MPEHCVAPKPSTKIVPRQMSPLRKYSEDRDDKHKPKENREDRVMVVENDGSNKTEEAK